jgi:plasmid maintenance system killer protein
VEVLASSKKKRKLQTMRLHETKKPKLGCFGFSLRVNTKYYIMFLYT